jgi:hypothetical protein
MKNEGLTPFFPFFPPIKEVSSFKGSVTGLVPDEVEKALKDKFKK